MYLDFLSFLVLLRDAANAAKVEILRTLGNRTSLAEMVGQDAGGGNELFSVIANLDFRIRENVDSEWEGFSTEEVNRLHTIGDLYDVICERLEMAGFRNFSEIVIEALMDTACLAVTEIPEGIERDTKLPQAVLENENDAFLFLHGLNALMQKELADGVWREMDDLEGATTFGDLFRRIRRTEAADGSPPVVPSI